MRQQILNIAAQIKARQGEMSREEDWDFQAMTDCVASLCQARLGMTEIEYVQKLRKVRNLMLDIMLRLIEPENVSRELLLEADRLWDGSMRENFVEDAEKLLEKPAVRDLFTECYEDEDQPMNDFLNQIDGAAEEKVDGDLAYFVHNVLSKEAGHVTTGPSA